MALIPPITFDGLTNPLEENLIANTFEIQNSSKVQATVTETDTIKLLPGSLATGIQFQDSLLVAGSKRIDFQGAALAGEGNINANPVHGLKIKGLTNTSGTPTTNLLSFDPTTLTVGYQPAGAAPGTVSSVTAGTNISVTGTASAPVVNVNISSDIDLNSQSIIDGGSATFAGAVNAGSVSSTNDVQAATVIALTGGVQATAGGLTALAGNITATTGNITATAGNITAVDGNINATSINPGNGNINGTSITALTGGLKSYAGLNLNPTGVLGAETDITGAGTITASEKVVCAVLPVANEDLANKDYVDQSVLNATSQWANFPAITQVNMNAQNITGAGTIDSTGNITTTANLVSAGGNVVCSTGDLVTIGGNVSALNGTVSANLINSSSGITNDGTLTTRTVAVASIDGLAPAEIAMALTTTAAPPDVLTMTYNPLSDDRLYVNKGMVLDGALNMGPFTANNIEGVLGLYASEIVESKTLQAIDSSAVIGDGSIIYKTTDPLFSDEAGTVFSCTYPDPTAQNTVLYARGALSLVDPPNGGLPAQIIINNVPQTLNGSDWSSYAATQSVDLANNDIQNAAAIGATSLYATGFITSDTTVTGLDVVATNSLTVGADALNVEQTLDFAPTNSLYVAKNGDDTTGNGSILQPFATIQKAIDTWELSPAGTPLESIYVAGGIYTEPITISKGYLQIIGNGISSNQTEQTQITGNILISLTTGVDDIINRQVVFNGLLINGPINDTSSKQHTVGIYRSRLFPQNGSNGAAITEAATAPMRFLMEDIEYTNDYPSVTPGVCFAFTSASLEIVRGDIQNSNDTTTFLMDGSSRIQRIENSYIANQTTLASNSPLIAIDSTATGTHSIANTALVYENATAKNAPGIKTLQAATINLLDVFFNLAGMGSAANAITYTGTAPTVQTSNVKASFNTAAAIQTGITVVPTTAMGLQGPATFQSITTGSLASSGAVSGGSLASGAGISGTSLTLSGTTSSQITGVNNMLISNANSAIPLDILNSGDNPSVRIRNAASAPSIPVEINLVNGSQTLAYGNQATDPRGSFWFFNGKDVFRCNTTINRLLMSYSPYSPLFATSGAAGAFVAGTGAFTSGVPKVLGTETITIAQTNFPIVPGGFGTPAYLGVTGFLNTCVLNGAHDFTVTVTYTRTRSGVTVGPYVLYGAVYPITSQAGGAFYSPLNGTSYNEAVAGERITFTHGDILTLTVSGLFVGGSPPNIVTPATGLAAVFSPFLF